MYADRTILSPVLGDIESEFGLSGAQLGLINSVFFLTYALMQIPSGALADRIGKKVVLVSAS
jgi:MFS family permease